MQSIKTIQGRYLRFAAPPDPYQRGLLIVGEMTKGIQPLWPHPPGRAGDRLRSLLGLTITDYLRITRVNLIDGVDEWSDEIAIDGARAVWEKLCPSYSMTILLGSRVHAAFCAVNKHFEGMQPLAVRVTNTLNPHTPPPAQSFMLLPHPSGRCRKWNNPEFLQLARDTLAVIVDAHFFNTKNGEVTRRITFDGPLEIEGDGEE